MPLFTRQARHRPREVQRQRRLDRDRPPLRHDRRALHRPHPAGRQAPGRPSGASSRCASAAARAPPACSRSTDPVTMPAFVPPGPGEWSLDRSHYPGGTTPIVQALIRQGFEGGFGRVFAEIGVPAERMDAAFVHGFMYTRLRPLIGADKPPRRPPPTPVLWAASRLHPAFRARTKAATATLRDRPSNAVVERWTTEIRPNLMAKNFRFQDVDPAAIDDDGTAAAHRRPARSPPSTYRTALLAARPRPGPDRPVPVRVDQLGPAAQCRDRRLERRVSLHGSPHRHAVRAAEPDRGVWRERALAGRRPRRVRRGPIAARRLPARARTRAHHGLRPDRPHPRRTARSRAQQHHDRDTTPDRRRAKRSLPTSAPTCPWRTGRNSTGCSPMPAM